MRSPRPLPPHLLRHVVAAAALLGQVVAAVGAPVPSRALANKSASVPFPCLGHPCGCSTSEQGWAGDCCCFTLEEKLAWADARDITPPPHVRPAVAARKAATKTDKSCCTKKVPACCDEDAADYHPPAAKAGLTWVAGVFAQKCRGEGFGGLLKLELVAAPECDSARRPAFAPTESARAADARATAISVTPPDPPPRSA